MSRVGSPLRNDFCVYWLHRGTGRRNLWKKCTHSVCWPNNSSGQGVIRLATELFPRWKMMYPLLYADVIKWKHVSRDWPLVLGIHRSAVNSPTKVSDAKLWCVLWSAPWINGCVNNREAGNLRHHRAHYDVIVMFLGGWNGCALFCH